MAEVGIHLHDEICTIGQGAAHAGHICGAKPAFACAVDDHQPRAVAKGQTLVALLGQRIGYSAGAVG